MRLLTSGTQTKASSPSGLLGMGWGHPAPLSSFHPSSCFVVGPRGEQCGGCRRSNTTDRPHAFQVILTDRPSLELSATDETEMADWMQHLCQAVSKGVSSPSMGRQTESRGTALKLSPRAAWDWSKTRLLGSHLPES